MARGAPWVSRSWLAAWLLLPLLGLLAFLQYRWTGDLSRAERERTEIGLRRSLAGLARDFDREISHLFSQFQPLAFDILGRPEPPDSVIRKIIGSWRAEATYPDLVRRTFLAERQANGTFGLRELAEEEARNPEETIPWPGDLSPLHQRLEAGEGSGDLPGAVAGDVPALVLPLLPESWLDPAPRHRLDGARRRSREIDTATPAFPRRDSRWGRWREERNGNENSIRNDQSSGGDLLAVAERRSPVRFLILWLDLATMTEEMLPSLATHHFAPGPDGTLDFHLTLLDFHGERILYQQGPALADPTAAPDGVIELLRLLPPVLSPRGSGSRRLPRELEGLRPFPAGPGELDDPAADIPGPETTRRRFPERSGPPSRLRAAVFSWLFEADLGQWRLEARHPAGSLDRAVARARRRNLLLSLGVLALLATGLGFLLVGTRRAQMLARQQLEFVAGVTHEFMTPLAALRSAGQNLADGVVVEPAQVQRYGRLIDREGRRLGAMVGQVLELAGMWSAQKTAKPEPTSLPSVIDAALAACEHELESAGFTVEQQLGEGLPQVMADPAALTRAFSNLFGNAVKYANDGAWLGIEARADTDHRRVEVRVRDRGPGIAATDLPHIFQPFRRGKGRAASVIPGSGLGLSLVKSIIESHGGEVLVEESDANGTTFLLRLPIASGGGP